MAALAGAQPAQLEARVNEGSELASLQLMVIRDGGTVNRVPCGDIGWIDAAGDYMCIHAGGVTHITRATMKDLEAQLDARRFVRIHRSTRVSIDRVSSVTPLENGMYRIELAGGKKLAMSRGYREQLRSSRVERNGELQL